MCSNCETYGNEDVTKSVDAVHLGLTQNEFGWVHVYKCKTVSCPFCGFEASAHWASCCDNKELTLKLGVENETKSRCANNIYT